jgi:hypothetical protein
MLVVAALISTKAAAPPGWRSAAAVVPILFAFFALVLAAVRTGDLVRRAEFWARRAPAGIVGRAWRRDYLLLRLPLGSGRGSRLVLGLASAGRFATTEGHLPAQVSRLAQPRSLLTFIALLRSEQR